MSTTINIFFNLKINFYSLWDFKTKFLVLESFPGSLIRQYSDNGIFRKQLSLLSERCLREAVRLTLGDLHVSMDFSLLSLLGLSGSFWLWWHSTLQNSSSHLFKHLYWDELSCPAFLYIITVLIMHGLPSQC